MEGDMLLEHALRLRIDGETLVRALLAFKRAGRGCLARPYKFWSDVHRLTATVVRWPSRLGSTAPELGLPGRGREDSEARRGRAMT